MKYYVETSLENFEAWSGAISTLDTLREKDLCDRLEFILNDLYPDGMTDTELNDLLWFEEDTIAEWLGFSDWEDLENDGEEEEADEADLEEAEGLLDECIGNEDDFDTFCSGCECSSCPFDVHCNLRTKCEEAYNYMLEGYNFDEAITLLKGEEV